MTEQLTQEERTLLLRLARQSLEQGLPAGRLPALDLASLPETLQQPGVCFVTLTQHGELRGCVGALEAYQPLALDVCEHALAAAMYDYRFPPVDPAELPEMEIEISRLTPPKPLHYDQPDQLLELLRPGVDGVVLRDGMHRATFLPQVWEKLPDPEQFLNHLCQKMGAASSLWRYKVLEVSTYQVEEFHE
jgi:AmmeMemoRadiSam system protein A